VFLTHSVVIVTVTITIISWDISNVTYVEGGNYR